MVSEHVGCLVKQCVDSFTFSRLQVACKLALGLNSLDPSGQRRCGLLLRRQAWLSRHNKRLVGPIVVVEVERRDDLLEGGQQLARESAV